MLTLYNSLSHKKDEFVPLKAGQAGVYSCGPTVYDHAHIGNLRSYITADILVRVLHVLEGLNVDWVMNITDIDDKMIDRMKQGGKTDDPMKALTRLADSNIVNFKRDIEKINISIDNLQLVRATEHIERMQQLITQLYTNKVAYVSEGSVYFSLAEYKKRGGKYGQLINVDFAPQARVTDDQDQKEGAADFALWKAKKVQEPFWDFELDGQELPGRPGWHIECSALSTETLGGEFDIHTGGIDLRFPHHENEIAQCGGSLARYFVHNEHLLVDNTKMSKSLNNFTTLEDIDDLLAFRYMVLQAHYRSQMNFSTKALQSAGVRLANLREKILRAQYLEELESDHNGAGQKFRKAFTDALEDDMNLPMALSALAAYENSYNTVGFVENVAWADKILGLDLIEPVKPFTLEEIALQKAKDEARTSKKYKEADELRKKLETQGIFTADHVDGSSEYWRK